MFKKVIFVLAVLILWNCAQPPAYAQSRLLTGRIWKLQTIDGKDASGVGATLEFDLQAGRFSGNGGCNRVFGRADVGQSSMKLTGTGSTRKACRPGEILTTEGRYVSALGKATNYRISGDELILYAGEFELLRFNGADEVRQVPNRVGLVDRKWLLDSIGKDRIGKVEQQPFIVFNPEKGSVGGNTGCNLFSGSYTTRGSSIKIDKGISTMRACVEDPTNLEQRFSDALAKVDRFELKGMTLLLYQGGSLLMSFSGIKKD